MFIFKSNMDKDLDQTCEYILKLKRAELFFHGIKKQDKTKFICIMRYWNTIMLTIKKKDI